MSETNVSSNWQGHGTIESEGDAFPWKPAADVARNAGDDFQLRLQCDDRQRCG